MKTFTRQAAQGDLLATRIGAIPVGMTPVAPIDGMVVVAHSETGHHHAFAAAVDLEFYQHPADPTTCYLSVGESGADLVHHRAHDTHETLHFSGGCYELRRQREHTPQGWRRVED